MEYLVAVILGLTVGGFATTTGFDRDRAFYPTVLIVVASYYALFAVMGASRYSALSIEIAVGLVFSAFAVLGFKKSMWLAAVGIAGHGFFDFFVHPGLVANPGMPVWWPGFCGTIDFVLGGWCAIHLWKTSTPKAGRRTTEHSELHKRGKTMNFKSIASIVTLISAFALAPASFGEAAPTCQTGKLLDVREDIEYIPTVQVRRVHRNNSKDWTTVELPSARKQTTYTVKVALDGIIYTARSSGDFWGYNPSKMTVGTELEACIEANKLVITRPDGKQYKPTITRRERDEAASH